MINKNICIIFSVILIIFIIVNYNHHIYISSNLKKHKDAISLYAHFSKIDIYNYLIFPKLFFAHPINFLLKEGESIYIPKQWWHWIKTTKKTFAINYWFNNNINVKKPFVFNNNTKYDINLLNNIYVSIWDSSMKTDNLTTTTFKEFYNSGENNKYIITLADYETGMINNYIKKQIEPYVKFPKNKNIKTDKFEYNVWVSSGTHDTGLHYDDEDGVLSVIEGEKEIIMFPPSDTKYLYPYKISYDWINNKPLNFRYNSYTYFNITTGISSGQLLYETAKHDKRVLANISKLYYKNKKEKNNGLIWGFKKNKDIYRWELYTYNLNSNQTVSSLDIMMNEYDIGNEKHYYYNNDTTIKFAKLPFWGHGKYEKNGKYYDESKIFVIDSYDSFNINYDNYMDKLEYSEIKDTFRDIILNNYECYEICIHNKNINQIFVQYLGISN